MSVANFITILSFVCLTLLSACAKPSNSLNGYWKVESSRVEGKDGATARTTLAPDAHYRFANGTFASYQAGKWTDNIPFESRGDEFTLVINPDGKKNPSGRISNFSGDECDLSINYSQSEVLIITLHLTRISQREGLRLERSGQQPLPTVPGATNRLVQQSDILGSWAIISRTYQGQTTRPSSQYVLFAMGYFFLLDSATTSVDASAQSTAYLIINGQLNVLGGSGEFSYFTATRTGNDTIVLEGENPGLGYLRYELRRSPR